MKVTPGLMALLTAVAFFALVGAGVGYVLTTDQTPASARSVPEGSTTPSSSATPAPSTSPEASPGATLTGLPTVKPSPKPRKQKKKVPTPTPTPTVAPPPTAEFSLTSFNVLGASHTKNGARGKASGPVRARRAATLIARHRSDVVGFQELQGSQLATLQRSTNLDFYPGFSLGRLDSENSIGWRRDRFTAVEKHVVKIPYFNGGRRAMPVVKLRSNDTGVEAWFGNFHNPAETSRFHRQQRFRDAATVMEANLANRLMESTGLPVFITGDMNERGAYFCRLTSRAPMIAARGGTNNGGRCNPGRPRAVDWIFGSQGVDFFGYFEDRSRLVDITTDHPVITTRVRIVGKQSATPTPAG